MMWYNGYWYEYHSDASRTYYITNFPWAGGAAA